MEPWEKERKEKYRDHDIVQADISDLEVEVMRGRAIQDFAQTRESSNVRLITSAFMGYLTSKGFRIVKEKK